MFNETSGYIYNNIDNIVKLDLKKDCIKESF